MISMAARHADGIFLSGCSPTQHTSIIDRARAINPEIGTALYQSASDRWAGDATVSSWADVGAVLAAEAARFGPTSIGINLVDLNDGSTNAVDAVEQAAAVLSTIT